MPVLRSADFFLSRFRALEIAALDESNPNESNREESHPGFGSTQRVPIEVASGAMSVLAGDELELRAVSVSPDAMVLLRHHLEASEGLGYLVARRGGDAFLVTHKSQSEALNQFIEDLRDEFGIRTNARPEHAEALNAEALNSETLSSKTRSTEAALRPASEHP